MPEATTVGATLHLRCAVSGGQLYLGALRAAQGHMAACGVVVSGRLRVRIDVTPCESDVPRTMTTWPRFVTPTCSGVLVSPLPFALRLLPMTVADKVCS